MGEGSAAADGAEKDLLWTIGGHLPRIGGAPLLRPPLLVPGLPLGPLVAEDLQCEVKLTHENINFELHSYFREVFYLGIWFRLA